MAPPSNSTKSTGSKIGIEDPGTGLACEEVSLDKETTTLQPFDPEKGDQHATVAPVDDESDAVSDPNIVWWKEPANLDPENPKNWSEKKKWGTIAIVSSITFITPLASSMFAPGIPEVMEEFNSNSDLTATFVVSVYILGYALGPLILAPLSEIYGRTILYNSCNVLFVIFTVLCAVSQNMGMLIAFRFLAGLVGVQAITCGSGTIADIIPPERRGLAMSIWTCGPLLGPVIGPIAGGFLISAKGWRWSFWLIAIVAGLITIMAFLLLRETYAPVLLERKAARLRKETGNSALRSKLQPDMPRKAFMKRSIVRPLHMLFFSPIVTVMSVYVAMLYGFLYILFTTYTFVFEETYNFSTIAVGLTYLGSGIGMFLGLFVMGTFSDRAIRKVMASGKETKPEDRLILWVVVPAATMVSGGLIMYGWTTNYAVHWIAPLVANGIIGCGMIMLMISIQTYLVDAFTIHAASVIAANAVLRSILGALLPLCGLDLYDALGLGWGNTLLGLLACALAPVPTLLRIFGERIRTSPKFQRKF
ncbi:MFS general substrate transporter [Aulographum hederae CBS 113979]|uniref:MFS general substrate transporter n=1 Tax=Aulographum hederae CBS 113979 TaxID=1176131 RepID=A0A6G1GJC9_9PEZI|nr:MFS general substrate transporter [Aulographum hederae CBS 113979]